MELQGTVEGQKAQQWLADVSEDLEVIRYPTRRSLVEMVDDAVLDVFLRALLSDSLRKRPKQIHRAACIIWNKAADRGAVTTAANTIDDFLARDPLGQGEARQGSTRILLVEPLAVYYDVDTAQRHVKVWDEWRYPP